MVRTVVESILSYLQDRTPDTVDLVTEMVTGLPCFHIMPQEFTRVLIDPLPSTEITRSIINQGCICVSALMGHYGMYNYFQVQEVTPFRGIHPYFGSPIWAAAMSGQQDFLKRLRIDGVNFYNIDYGLYTPLRGACILADNHHKQSALVLLDSMISGGQIHLDDLRTSLIYARETQFLPLFRLLTEPAVRGLIRIELENVLHLENGDNARQLTKLLITRGVDPNTRALLDLLEVSSTTKLTTPLQDAVNNHKRARIDLLLAHGADPNMVASADGLSPLEVALRQRSPDVVDTLLRHGAAKYADSTNNGTGFNILTHPDAWAHPPTWQVCLSHFDMSEPRSPDSPNGPRLYRTINDYAYAYAALLEAVGRGRRDLVLRLMDRDVSIHGRWDPPLPPFPSANRRWMVTDPRAPLPRRHVMLAPPALQAALLAGDQAMVNFLFEHGAVWNYPYDYLLREPGESAIDVEKRVARVRGRANLRDEEEERREREARRRERETLRAANASPN
ncbi:Ankyrin repeat and SOCS box protein 15 [Lasiodiplodia theobromae]|uniref:Ankyrin repeat and SOCS box protein 15 n=2 Tax=Lasiodiplodia theobromae TaxID=45133 RepID=A0A5N5DRF3_9PEZI|nr:Ankyrin repeat and SOCS box protein 15 [Lasiodiplodia theobromae]